MIEVAPAPASRVQAGTPSAIHPRVINPLCVANWDDLLASHRDATFFHGRAWAQTLASTYDFGCHYLVAQRGGELRALLPIMETRSWLRGTRAVALPFTDESPALTSREVSGDSLLAAAAGVAGERGWEHLEMCVTNPDARTATHYAHRISLGADADSIHARFDSATRRAVRKAERAGVSVEFGSSLEFVRAYYRLHCRTRTRLGSPPQPFRFFRAICDHILQPGHGFIALARLGKRIIAGAMFFEFNGKALYKFSASDERFQELRGANLVISRAIQKLVADGARELSFGRTSLDNMGLRRFKLGWGAEESTIARVRYSFADGSTTTLADLAGGLHARAFAALPVFVSRWIGAAAYPHLS
jgi:CelD/BcsL family acetyltransferase involved in cellulose biosynthesis